MAKTRITDIGAEIKKALIDKNLTQIELARMIEVPPAYIHAIIYGYRGGQKYLPQISRILDIRYSGSKTA